MTTSHQQLFDWQVNAMKTIRTKTNTQCIRNPGKKHPCFYDLDPAVDYSNWSAPNDFWWRNNGKKDKRFVGNEEMPLIRCIRNLNKQARDDKHEFVWKDETLIVWAHDSECSVAFLAAAILADNTYKLKGTEIYDRVCELVDRLGEEQ